MEEVYGWAVEKVGAEYFITAATKERKTSGHVAIEEIMCHDISGFRGSWKMRKDGVFFPTVTGGATCSVALEQACKYAKECRGFI